MANVKMLCANEEMLKYNIW